MPLLGRCIHDRSDLCSRRRGSNLAPGAQHVDTVIPFGPTELHVTGSRRASRTGAIAEPVPRADNATHARDVMRRFGAQGLGHEMVSADTCDAYLRSQRRNCRAIAHCLPPARAISRVLGRNPVRVFAMGQDLTFCQGRSLSARSSGEQPPRAGKMLIV